jgi:uncharacterized protein (DUF433 family)
MTAPAPAIVDVGSLLYMLPSPAGGRLCVTGTGVSVRQISILYNEPLTAEEIAGLYAPHLPLSGVHAAIAYYLANKARMDQALLDDEAEAERVFAYYQQHGKLPDFDAT